MSENHFFAEQELCNSRLSDRVVDKQRRKQQPEQWAHASKWQESRVVSRNGVVARVLVEHEADACEPVVAAGLHLLMGLDPVDRQSVLNSTTALDLDCDGPPRRTCIDGQSSSRAHIASDTRMRDCGDGATSSSKALIHLAGSYASKAKVLKARQRRRLNIPHTPNTHCTSAGLDASKLSFSIEDEPA